MSDSRSDCLQKDGPNTPLRVIFVEDCGPDVQLALDLLKRAGFDVAHECVDTEEALRQSLSAALPDVILSDYSMPRFDGGAALRVARELAPGVPFIYLSGAIGEERAIESLHHGASDYVLKSHPQRLAGAVHRALKQVSERNDYEERIQHSANYDRLTDLPNRRLLEDRGAQAVSHARRAGRPCALFIIDIDRFHLVNESFGHAVGDRLLRLVAQRLDEVLRDGDTLARFGDDAYALLATDLARSEDALVIVRKIVERTQAPFVVEGHELRVTVSVGASTFSADGDTFEIMLRNATSAKHRVKEDGGNHYQFYLPQMNESARQTLELEAELNRAVERGEFVVHYQPKVDLSSGLISGFEALLRWNHPMRGLVAPGEFMGVLEDAGLIVELSEWMLVNVCRQIRMWQGQGLQPHPVAINLSPRQFRQKNLDAFVKTVLDVTGVDPALLELELTESTVMHDVIEAGRVMKNLAALGVRLAIDDFGTGYSSLAYLRHFPIHALKIDRAFVREIPASHKDAAIAQAIINLAHTLQFEVIAEGVETRAQVSFLSSHGCDHMQGYYFSAAVTAPEVAAMLGDNRQLQWPVAAADDGRRTLLLLDDEDNVLAAVKRVLRPHNYRVFTANNAQAALDILASHQVGVVVSDQRMPGGAGVEFLRSVKALYPDTVRMVLTGYTDFGSVSEAINEGAIYRLMTKPWDDNLLRAHVVEAFGHYAMAKDNRRMQKEARAKAAELARANAVLQALVEAGGAKRSP